MAAAEAAALFRAVLRLHRRLPPPMRALGDAYARDEFRRHLRGTTTPAQWRTFVGEWERYAAMLRGTADLGSAAGSAASTTAAGSSSSSGELSEALLAELSVDQRQRLELLRREAQVLGGGAAQASSSDSGGRAPGSTQ